MLIELNWILTQFFFEALKSFDSWGILGVGDGFEGDLDAWGKPLGE